MEFKDERLKILNEILSGIKVVKLYAWEPSMAAMVEKVRENELTQLRKQLYARVVQEAGYYATPLFVRENYIKFMYSMLSSYCN